MPADTRDATIEQITDLSQDVREIVLRLPGPPLQFRPGQWVSLHLPVGDRPPLVRAYSLARPDDGTGRLTFCLDRVPEGLGSGYLFERTVGDRITLAGPLGNFVLPEPMDSDLVFVAHFTGIVPFRCMLLALDGRRTRHSEAGRPRVHLVYGAPNAAELIYHEEFRELAACDPRFDYHAVVPEADDRWAGAIGTELDLLAEHAVGWMPFTPMVCGVRQFTRAVRTFFQEMGFDRREVLFENYN